MHAQAWPKIVVRVTCCNEEGCGPELFASSPVVPQAFTVLVAHRIAHDTYGKFVILDYQS